jgi:hypothetical protein
MDGKASALMTFDSILLAAASVSLSQPPESMSLSRGLVAASGPFSLVSVILSLAAVAIDWPFLGKVLKRSNGSYDFATEIDSLKRVMIFRQDSYRAAWLLALVSVGFFLAAYGGHLCKLIP